MGVFKEKEASLCEELPYWDFFSTPLPHAVLSDSSIVMGFQSELLDIECMDDSEVNNLTMAIRNCLNSVSEGSYIQFYLDVDSNFNNVAQKHIDLRKDNLHPLIANIAKSRDSVINRDIEERNLYNPKLKIYLRRVVETPRSTSILKKAEEFTKVNSEHYDDLYESVSQDLGILRSAFESLGLHTHDLTKETILEDIYKFFNPKRSKDIGAPAIQSVKNENLEEKILSSEEWLANSSPREQLTFGDLVLSLKQFTLDLYHHRVISLKTLPENTFAGQLSHFLRMPFHYSILLSIYVPYQSTEMAKLQQKRKMAHSLAANDSGKASDLESESKLSATEELIRELLNTGQKIYSVQMNVLLKEEASKDGEKKLNRQVRDVLSRFRSLQGAEALEETVGSWKVIKGNFPMSPIKQERSKKMKTNNLADFIPLYGPRKGDENPVILFRNRMNGLISYDPFDSKLNNYNCLVTGSSGSGKSFLNNCILLQEMARGLRVFVIDIGGSYKKLTEALEGQYIEMDLSEKYKINPFHINDIETGPSNQKIKTLLSMIECMVTDEGMEKLDKYTKIEVEKEIIALYEQKKTEGKIPILSDLESKLKKSSEPSLKKIAKMLYIWTGNRPYGKLLDGQGELRTNAEICSFDLKGLSQYPDLQSVMILTLTDFILSQVEGDRSVKKRIILDEAWELLKSQAAATFMEYSARTLRKTGSGITFITQGVEEIANSPIGSAILNNTATKILMLQRGDIDILRKTLKLNSQELELIQSLKQMKGHYSEGFLIEGLESQVIQVHPSPLEYWLATSDANDNNYLYGLIEDGMNFNEAVGKAAEKYPHGINQT
jgi:type-IV secretion system protein TraC